MVPHGGRRRGLRAPFVAAIGLALLVGGGGAATAEERYAVERFQVADRKEDQVEPRASGDWIVWKDYRGLSLREVDDSPNGEIYAWNLSTNQEYQVSKSKDAGHPAISGSRVVWTEGSRKTTEIFGFDLDARGRFKVAESHGRQEHPAISGDLVVWQDNRNGNWDIFGRDLAEVGDFAIVEHTRDQQRPAISGRTVVWEDWRDYGRGPNVYVMDLDGGNPDRLTKNHDAFEPAISGRWVVWVGRTDPGVFARKLGDDRQIRLSGAGGAKSRPAISGDIVVWTDERHGNRDVYGYDLKAGREFVVVKSSGQQDYPHVDGKTIVWSDGRGPNRDIYAGNVGAPNREKPPVEAPVEASVAAPPPAGAAAPAVLQLRVVGTDGAGVKLRAAPGLGGTPLKTVPEGAVLVAIGETRQADGLTWRNVRDPDGAEGWVAAEYVAALQ